MYFVLRHKRRYCEHHGNSRSTGNRSSSVSTADNSYEASVTHNELSGALCETRTSAALRSRCDFATYGRGTYARSSQSNHHGVM